MKFCLYSWNAPHYRYGDPPHRPSGNKDLVCTKEHGHSDDHESDTGMVAANIKARSVR